MNSPVSNQVQIQQLPAQNILDEREEELREESVRGSLEEENIEKAQAIELREYFHKIGDSENVKKVRDGIYNNLVKILTEQHKIFSIYQKTGKLPPDGTIKFLNYMGALATLLPDVELGIPEGTKIKFSLKDCIKELAKIGKESHDEKRAGGVVKLFDNFLGQNQLPEEILKAIDEIAKEISRRYQNQINKLDDVGCTVFYETVSTSMLNRLAEESYPHIEGIHKFLVALQEAHEMNIPVTLEKNEKETDKAWTVKGIIQYSGVQVISDGKIDEDKVLLRSNLSKEGHDIYGYHFAEEYCLSGYRDLRNQKGSYYHEYRSDISHNPSLPATQVADSTVERYDQQLYFFQSRAGVTTGFSR